MSSQDTLPKNKMEPDFMGKLVWVFRRDDKGLPIDTKAECGVVVDIDDDLDMFKTIYVVQVGDNYYNVWEEDLELVEDWNDEDQTGGSGEV